MKVNRHKVLHLVKRWAILITVGVTITVIVVLLTGEPANVARYIEIVMGSLGDTVVEAMEE